MAEKIEDNESDTDEILENMDQWDLSDRIDVKLYSALD